MALPTNMNLGEMRQDISNRLGYAAQGSRAGPTVASINSLLRQSQYQMYWFIDWKYLISTNDITTGVGQRFYDWPDNCDPLQLLNVVCEDTTVGATGSILPMKEGIDWEHDSYASPNDRPRRFERRSQIEVWPPADATTYIVRLEYVQRLGRFTQDSDLCTIDSELVLMHAMTLAKAHIKASDAGIYREEMKTLLENLKRKNFGSRRIKRQRPTRYAYDNYDDMIHKNTLDL